MSVRQNSVIGIVRSGSVHPFADSSIASETVEKSDSINVQTVSDWARKRVLKPEIETEIGASGFPIKDHKLNANISVAWFYGYDQMKTTNDSSKIYWYRFLAESAVISNLNRFTRVDGLSYFTRSVVELWNPAKDAPQIGADLEVEVELSPSGPSIKSNIALRINSNTSSADADTITPPLATGWVPGGALKWKLTHDTDTQANPVAGDGSLPHLACNWPNGVCEWTSLDLVRKDGSMWRANTLVQASARIIATFDRKPDASDPPRWKPEKFIYGVDLEFTVSKDQRLLTVSESPIG